MKLRRTRKNKHNADPTWVHGRWYASKKEAQYAKTLWLAKAAGTVLYWHEQVPFRFSSGVKYFVDFMVCYSDHTLEYVEVKGYETDVYKLKMRMLADEYPDVEIVVVR